MKPPRISIAAVLAIVGAIALGMAALVYASPAWVVVMQVVTLALLFTSILGAIRGRDVAWWRGVALFGWGFLLLDGLNVWWVDPSIRPQAHVVALCSDLYPIVYHDPPVIDLRAQGLDPQTFAPGAAEATRRNIAMTTAEHRAFQSVGVWLSRLLFALLGGVVGRVILTKRHAVEG